ncbi:DUF58 domain-containing protein [Vibrio parahaemolyticus]|uniref:DUF58 domain-containing protein n=1 Tax=Vibrio mediterranei TaxID=689 RepID=UPI0040696349
MANRIDPRIAVTVSDLMLTKQSSGVFTLPSSHHIASRLSGGHLSGYRGRGLDFEEFRQYQSGDDVRNIDWLVTMKTNQPHLRIFQEEKDRSVLFCVDQSRHMFFSTLETMKSVAVAHVMAACSWQVLRQGDRVGALVFGDNSSDWFPPRRSQGELLNVFRALAERGLDLAKKDDSRKTSEPEYNLDHALYRLSLKKPKGALIVLISDVSGFDSQSIRRLTQLKRHNDLMCIAVQDPMEQSLLVDETLCFSDGEYQIAIEPGFAAKIANYNSSWQRRQRDVKVSLQSMGIPYVELDTSGEHLFQLTAQLNGGKNVKK